MLLFFCGLVLFLGMREPSDAFPPFTTAGPTYVNPTFSPGLRRTRMENAIISTNTNQHPGDWRAAGQIMYEKPELTNMFGPCHSGGTICLLHLKISIFLLDLSIFSLPRKTRGIKSTLWYHWKLF